MQKESSYQDNGYQSHRRKYLKAAGSAITGVCLAGCLGGGGGTEGGGGNSGTTTIEYWDTFNVQSKAARQTVENVISRFEDKYDAKVKVNFSGFGPMAGSEWITRFEAGEYPVIFTGDQIVAGRFEEAGYIKPFNEWSDKMSNSIQQGLKWMLNGPIKAATAWMAEHPNMKRKPHMMPVGLAPQEPVEVRADHMRKAGLDPDSDFPPESYEHLVQLATTLQEDGPGKYGFQLHGQKYDWYTFIEPYTDALGADKGEAGYFSSDYHSVNYDTDTWIQVISDSIDLYRKYGVSGPQTVSISEDDTVPLFVQGEVSMSPLEPMSYPTLMETAPDLMESGDIRYGSFWTEPSGVNNALLSYGLAITNAPDGVDESKWQKKQDLAIKFAEMWFEEKTQTSLFQGAGFLPVRRDLWSKTAKQLPYNDASHAFKTMTTMAEENTRGVHTSFPLYISASSDIGALMAKGYKGELTAEEVANQGAEAGNAVVNDYWSTV